jgi:hypothetical protein
VFSSVYLPALILASLTILLGAWTGSRGIPGPGTLAVALAKSGISLTIESGVFIFNAIAAFSSCIYALILLIPLLLIGAAILGLIGLIILGTGMLLGVQQESNLIGQFLVSIIYILWSWAGNIAIFVIQIIARIIEWLTGNVTTMISIISWTIAFTAAFCCFLILAELIYKLGGKYRNSHHQWGLFFILWSLPEFSLLLGFFIFKTAFSQ